jgi:hypothetical protein
MCKNWLLKPHRRYALSIVGKPFRKKPTAVKSRRYGKEYVAEHFENGDTRKELLARSHY